MAYSLSLDDLAASVKRVAGEQLGARRRRLDDPDDRSRRFTTRASG